MDEQGFGRTIAVLAVFGCIKVSLSQRCESAGYTVITDPYRSTNATIGTPFYKAISDHNLVEDLWYRFDSYVGSTIPERAENDFVAMYKCGTVYPVYIAGLNSHPTEDNQTTVATVFGGYNDYLHISHWNATILIHKCPAQVNTQSYFLYKLKKVPWAKAYCAGEGVPCNRKYYWNGSTCIELRNETLVITAYQQVRRFYIDGVAVENLNSDGNPSTPDYINLKPNTRLIALDAVNNGVLTCGGVLASTVDESIIITDSRFICFGAYNSDWMTLGYDDSYGIHALEYDDNTDGRINCSQYGPIADIDPNAKWIWPNYLYYGTVVCRGYTTFCETSSPCLNNGTCLKNSPKMCMCTSKFTGIYCETELRNETLVITAYQQVRRFYIDGVAVENLNSDGDPNTPDYINMEPNTRLIALDAVHYGILSCGGVIASTVDQSIITDSRFICFDSYNSDWMTLGYDDSYGGQAMEYGDNTRGRINCSQNGPIADIVPNAKWIWQNINGDAAVVCRGYTNYCETSSPCLNGGTCLKNSPNMCACAPYFTGKYCETAFCETSSPCLNDGKCLKNNPQMCTCTPQFTGQYCETGLQGGLTMKPTNHYARSDSPPTEPTILSCSSRANQTDVYPRWSFSLDGSESINITTPDCSVLSSAEKSYPNCFSTSLEYSTRTCNLTISKFYINSVVGLYTCTDATLDFAVALVDTIDHNFTVRALSSLGPEVVQGEQISMTCSVRLFHKTSSYFQLTPSVHMYSGNDQSPIIISNTAASINVAASSEVLPPYVCNINFTLSINPSINLPSKFATNLPLNISLTLTSPPVLYWPEERRMVIQGDANGRVVANGYLTCSVTANPPVTYQWTSEETRLLPIGSTVAVTHNGTYTCTAYNTIRGKTYNSSKSINITITIIDGQKNESEDKSLIVGIVLGIAVLLLLVVAIVEFVLLRRKKNSATIDVNYDYIAAVVRTDADPARDQGYELTQRERYPDVDQGGAVATSGQKNVPHMYDRLANQSCNTEIHSEDKSQEDLQPYDTEIQTEDKSQENLQPYDTEIQTEDKSDPYLALYE